MIVIVDYGVGNLLSVEKAVLATGFTARVTADPVEVASAEKIILPGVGSFQKAMAELEQHGLAKSIHAAVGKNVALLGICLGMQLLFQFGEEHGLHPGLGLLPGRVRRISAPNLKIPHTGWNQISWHAPAKLLRGLHQGSFVYFNHSYVCRPERQEDIIAVTHYGREFVSIVGHGRVYGVQFHPEKSQQVGLNILGNFLAEI